jgi:hypothetical protein
VRISDFVLFQKEGSDHYTGYANYFGLERYACIVKKTGGKFVVLVEFEGKWKQIGMFYPQNGKVRGAKDYELVGVIWTPEYTFHVLKDGNRFLGL